MYYKTLKRIKYFRLYDKNNDIFRITELNNWKKLVSFHVFCKYKLEKYEKFYLYYTHCAVDEKCSQCYDT